MSRYRGARLRVTRRLGDLPGLTRKSAKRAYPPGQHGQARRKRSEYAIRLEEKQKLRFNYGISERQLVRYVKKARAQEGSTGTNILKLLEGRLDNVCFRCGLGPTIPGARQLVNHGHITVNGRVVDIPSYQCRAGDVVAVRETKASKNLASPMINSFLKSSNGTLASLVSSETKERCSRYISAEHQFIHAYLH